MSLTNQKSDSELSSDSSWTFINNSGKSSKKSSVENVALSIENVTKAMLEEQAEDSAKKQVENTKPPLKKKPKKLGKTKRACKNHPLYVDPLNVLTIAACLFTVTGLALLTAFLPINYAQSQEIENLQSHLTEVYKLANDPVKENVAKSLGATAEAISTANDLKLFTVVPDSLADDEEEEEVCKEEYFNATFAPPVELLYENKEGNLDNTTSARQGKVKFLSDMAYDFIKSPNLQMFVATLVQDLCLLKLLSEFSKRTSHQEQVEVPKPKPKTKRTVTTKSKVPKPKKKVEELGLKKASESHNDMKENGKSECERRFEELDTRWATLGHNHRQKIQQIKSKFQKEIFQIKELEKTGYNRTQKINFTREKFLQRLKTDREVYLHHLRKLREERKKVLDKLCSGAKQSQDLAPKDAAVGNYVVVLPSNLSFQSKVEELKAESAAKLQAVNNLTVSYIPSAGDEKKPKNYEEKYLSLKKKYLKKKAKLEKKRQAKKDVTEVKKVMESIVNTLSDVASKSVVDESSGSNNDTLSLSDDGGNEHQDFQVVMRKRLSKRSLYEIAFEDDAKKIMQNDSRKWVKTSYEGSPQPVVITKRDPSKTHKAKIMHKGVL